MTQEEFQFLLKKYIEGTCTDEEKQYIENFDQNLLLGNTPIIDEQKSLELQERYLTKIQQRIKQSHAPAKTRTLWRPYLVGIAASVLILFLAYVILLLPDQGNSPVLLTGTSSQVIQNADTTSMTITLPDRSMIILEPGAVIKYNEDSFQKEKREVELEGIAFFDITKDPARPFLVYTNDVVTKVLGTSFTIRAERNSSDVTVWVKSGKVSVSAVKGDGVIVKEALLTPNHKAIVNLNEKSIATTVVEKPQRIITPDQVKKLRFDNSSVSEVFIALEEMYGIDILFDENTFANCKIRTSISEGEMFNRLDIICNVIGATYTVEGNYIAIHGSGCN